MIWQHAIKGKQETYPQLSREYEHGTRARHVAVYWYDKRQGVWHLQTCHAIHAHHLLQSTGELWWLYLPELPGHGGEVKMDAN